MYSQQIFILLADTVFKYTMYLTWWTRHWASPQVSFIVKTSTIYSDERVLIYSILFKYNSIVTHCEGPNNLRVFQLIVFFWQQTIVKTVSFKAVKVLSCAGHCSTWLDVLPHIQEPSSVQFLTEALRMRAETSSRLLKPVQLP